MIIPIQGEISVYGSSGLFSSGTSAQAISSQIESADSNPSIKAIILEINSPGGTVVGSKEIAKAVENCNKPVVAWMREVAASGAYWISASADIIVADEATITGSVGVTGSYLEFSGFFEEYGIGYERLVSGQFKDTGSPYKDLAPSERQLLQSKIDLLNEQFIEHIKNSRSLTNSQISKLSTAQLFLGVEAKENGMVDILGSRNEAQKSAENLAGIENSVLIYQQSGDDSFLLSLLDMFSGQMYWMGRGIGDSFITKQAPNIEILARA